MITRRGFAGTVLLGAAVLAVGACSKTTDISFHYRLTAEVETPEGVRSGSGVLRVVAGGRLPGFEALGGGGLSARGEAVPVDLANGRTLFVLLSNSRNSDWAADAFSQARAAVVGTRFDDGDPNPSEYVAKVKADPGPYPVRRWVEHPNGSKVDDYPMLVTFNDIADPTSVKRVDPDNLAASFGPGYRLKAITVQVTDEPVTVEIGERLRWLGKYPEPALNPKHGPTDYSPSATIKHGDFRTNSTK